MLVNKPTLTEPHVFKMSRSQTILDLAGEFHVFITTSNYMQITSATLASRNCNQTYIHFVASTYGCPVTLVVNGTFISGQITIPKNNDSSCLVLHNDVHKFATCYVK